MKIVHVSGEDDYWPAEDIEYMAEEDCNSSGEEESNIHVIKTTYTASPLMPKPSSSTDGMRVLFSIIKNH